MLHEATQNLCKASSEWVNRFSLQNKMALSAAPSTFMYNVCVILIHSPQQLKEEARRWSCALCVCLVRWRIDKLNLSLCRVVGGANQCTTVPVLIRIRIVLNCLKS